REAPVTSNCRRLSANGIILLRSKPIAPGHYPCLQKSATACDLLPLRPLPAPALPRSGASDLGNSCLGWTAVTINQPNLRLKVALRHAVTAMPLLKGRMRNKAQRFAEHVSYGVRASSRHARGLRNVKFNINSDWWDALFKMLSIVLVPLTVAGMGWYWTKWQQ